MAAGASLSEKRRLDSDVWHVQPKILRRYEKVCVPRPDRREETVCVRRADRREETVCVRRADRREETVCVRRADGRTPDRGESCEEWSCDVSDKPRVLDDLFPRRPWEESGESSDDELGQLDIDLDRKSKQHNLTSSNVRTILHEVITHEHVVAMMKAAIQATQDLPIFEPKMTRARLRQVAQQNMSTGGARAKPPQFVDILLEDDEDSSDEEYCPEEEEEEEEEEIFLSDADSMGSSPRMPQGSQSREAPAQQTDGPTKEAAFPRHPRVEAPPCPPADSSFLERLHAVEEELTFNPTCPGYQPLTVEGENDDDDDDDDASGLAYRTRSKRPLVDIPLGRLEAELLAPDITADMYDESAALQEEDRHWARWLQGLMASDHEEEGDDEDDPEYNFLDDLQEPDLEDYRTDRAVRITKREVNELLEELFDTFQEEPGNKQEEEGEEEEEEVEVEVEVEVPEQNLPQFNVPQALRFQAPLDSLLTERRRAVRQQYEALQQRRALQDTPAHHHDNLSLQSVPGQRAPASTIIVPGRICPALYLDRRQKLQLQQQVQQHVQLLTQVHLLSRHIEALNHEASITKQYLEELQRFSGLREELGLPSSFRALNLQEALDLLQEVEEREEAPPPRRPCPAVRRRLLPSMSLATSSRAYPLLPADAAWLFATRSVFLHPELLPICSLDPDLHPHRSRTIYTSGEDCLIVLGLRHFECSILPEQLLSSFLLCKKHENVRRHISEMCGPNAPQDNVIKLFCQSRVVPLMPVACSRVLPGQQRPPVDRVVSVLPNWLKKSQQIIQKTRLVSGSYPLTLPDSCTLRLHPSPLRKPACQTTQRSTRMFTLNHTASLPPLAKAPADQQPVGFLAHVPGASSQVITPLAEVPAKQTQMTPLPPTPQTLPTFAVCPGSAHSARGATSQSLSILTIVPPISSRRAPTFTKQPDRHHTVPPPAPPPSSQTVPDQPAGGGSSATMKPDHFLVQSRDSQHALGLRQSSRSAENRVGGGEELMEELESLSSASTLSPLSSPGGRSQEEEEENRKWSVGYVAMTNGGEEEQEAGGTGAGDGDLGGAGDGGGGGEGGGAGDRDQDGEGDENGERDEAQSNGERDDDGEKDGDGDQDRQGEEEEEEDFDDLTQDEDEEEAMSSASEESVLSVPELQETMKQLTWLASEGRLCGDADSEEDHSPASPTSPGSQEDNSEEEEEGPAKGEESGEGRSAKMTDEEMPPGEGTPRSGGKGPGRGRGRARPPRGLRRSRQERNSKDSSKLLLLYDDNILDNDPHRESKDIAFAQSYLTRVREALQDVPGKVEEFLALLYESERVDEGRDVVALFRRLHGILGDRTDLLRDFAAFLHPEQALECGLFEEQQAFERSRRFLRQLEISFGENPSHYQKIIKALQGGADLSPASIHELKAQMSVLLKGHTHLQGEFWVFFDELRPPPARPGQFEEAHWPDEGGGSDGGEVIISGSGGGASSGFEEVTLPELEEEEEGHKIQPMASRRRRRKIGSHGNYKECDWSGKNWRCLCHDAKIRRHKRKGCPRCHSNKTSDGVSRAMKSLDPLYSQIGSAHDDPGDKDRELDSELKEEDDSGTSSPQPEQSIASWESSFPLADEKEEEDDEMEDEEEEEDEEERKNSENEQSPLMKRSRGDEENTSTCTSCCSLSSVYTSSSTSCSISTSSSSTCTSSVSLSVSTSSVSTQICISNLDSSTALSSSTITSPCSSSSSAVLQARPSPPPDLPVCAKNISLTASGEKVILWTREADRVILTTCQQEGANQNTFQAISSLLGNKTPSEVSRRFRDLMRLFRTAARQTSSEDEAPPTEPAAASEEPE